MRISDSQVIEFLLWAVEISYIFSIMSNFYWLGIMSIYKIQQFIWSKYVQLYP